MSFAIGGITIRPVATSPQQSDPALTACLGAIIRACDAGAITREAIGAPPADRWFAELSGPPAALLGIGKASAPMARAAIAILGAPARGGVVITPAEVAARSPVIDGCEMLRADHPAPSARNVEAARVAVALIEQLAPGETLLCLISGGGSAHLTLPAGALTIRDIARASAALMRAGATIREINVVRKHCETLKGGGLARIILGRGACVIGLALSDVVGDPIDVIASGPLSPDPSTFADALAALERHDCRTVSPAVTERLEAGARGEIPETLKAPTSPTTPTNSTSSPAPAPADDRIRLAVIANHERPAQAAADACRAAGYEPAVEIGLEGDAGAIGREMADAAAQAPRGAAIVRAGEWTVDARSAPPGARGGPSQELALAAAIALDGRHDIRLLAYSTDGLDGPTPAAGAIIDSKTCARARAAGLDPAAALRDHDSHSLLSRIGATLAGGPTGTNLNHVAVALVGGNDGGNDE